MFATRAFQERVQNPEYQKLSAYDDQYLFGRRQTAIKKDERYRTSVYEKKLP